MTITLSVVIPTYNRSDLLPQVFDRLKQQITPPDLAWEVLVVDNNSTDDTAQVVKDHQSHWPAHIPLKYCFEPRQGAAFARQHGIEQAQGELVGFLDDDNLPRANWVTTAVEFAQQHPQAGAYGGKCRGVFEEEPLPEVIPLLRFLVIRDLGPDPFLFRPDRLQLPPSAGLVVRRKAWLGDVPPVLTGNYGLTGGEDYEVCLHMAHGGWEIWYCPDLVIDHWIPKERLDPVALKRLIHRYGSYTGDLLLVAKPRWQHPLILLKSGLGSVKRILSHFLRHGRQAQATLEADCMLAFHVGNLEGTLLRWRRSPVAGK